MIDFREIFTLAIQSIRRNKTRSALTMLGIIIGVAAVILLVSLGAGLQKYITGQFEQLGSNLVVVLPGRVSIEGGFSQGSAPNFIGSKLKVEQAAELSRLGGPIQEAGAAIETSAAVKYLGKSKYTTVAGITANYGRIRNIQVAQGRNITDTDVTLGRKVVILGKGIATTLFGQSEALGKEITIGEDRFQVVGILEQLGTAGIGFDVDNFVAIPVTAGQRLAGTDAVQTIVVKAASKELIPQAITATKKYFLNQGLTADDLSVLDQSNLLSLPLIPSWGFLQPL